MLSSTLIAAKLLESYALVRPIDSTLYATKINIQHTPNVGGDGFWDREFLTSHSHKEHEAWLKAMPDFHYDGISLAITSDAVNYQFTIKGTRANGSEVSVAARMTYHIEDGLIAGITSWLDMNAIPALIDAMTEGGYSPQQLN